MRRGATVLAGGLVALAVVAATTVPVPADAAPPNAKRLVQTYLKAKKDADRQVAWSAIEAAPCPEDRKEQDALAALVLEHLTKTGRKVASKRDTWFDVEADGWEGTYIPDRKRKGAGLVLGLHGGGAGSGDCDASAGQFAGPIGSLGLNAVFPEVLRKTEYGWTDPPDTERWVLELLKACRRTWDVDPNRVYVTGHSMGGYGTWTYGAVHADLFAAGAAFAGAPSIFWKPGGKDKDAESVADGILPNLRNLPLFVYQSLDDRNVPPAANVFAAARLAELHAADPDGWEHVYEQVDGRGHGFPEGGPSPGLAWMAGHVRDPRPTTVHWQPVRTWKTSFYWITWDDPWIGCTLIVRVDRATNAISVSTKPPHGVLSEAAKAQKARHLPSLGFYLDERLVDVGKPVVVTVDGEEKFRGVVPPQLSTLVRSAEEREDPEYVFARRLRFDRPGGR